MEGTIGEIRLWAGNFAPLNWAFCQGQLISISQNDALFSILGTTYGGDGIQTFGLPDYRGRVAVGVGQGPGLSNYVQGQMTGQENVVLTSSNLAQHTHNVVSASMLVSGGNADTASAAGNYLAVSSGIEVYSGTGTSNTMAAGTVSGLSSLAGNSQPVSVLQPYQVLNVIICMEGIYPSRN